MTDTENKIINQDSHEAVLSDDDFNSSVNIKIEELKNRSIETGEPVMEEINIAEQEINKLFRSLFRCQKSDSKERRRKDIQAIIDSFAAAPRIEYDLPAANEASEAEKALQDLKSHLTNTYEQLKTSLSKGKFNLSNEELNAMQERIDGIVSGADKVVLDASRGINVRKEEMERMIAEMEKIDSDNLNKISADLETNFRNGVYGKIEDAALGKRIDKNKLWVAFKRKMPIMKGFTEEERIAVFNSLVEKIENKNQEIRNEVKNLLSQINKSIVLLENDVEKERYNKAITAILSYSKEGTIEFYQERLEELKELLLIINNRVAQQSVEAGTAGGLIDTAAGAEAATVDKVEGERRDRADAIIKGEKSDEELAAQLASEEKFRDLKKEFGKRNDKEIDKFFIPGTIEQKKTLQEVEGERRDKADAVIKGEKSDEEIAAQSANEEESRAQLASKEEKISRLKAREAVLWGEINDLNRSDKKDEMGVRYQEIAVIQQQLEELEKGTETAAEKKTGEAQATIEPEQFKTAEEVLREMGLEINLEDLKGELKCEVEKETVKLKLENNREILEFLKSLGLKDKDIEIICDNVQFTLNSALDAEAERDFSNLWKHHKKVLAAGIGVGALAALGSISARMTGARAGGRFIAGAGKIIMGGAYGALAGSTRGLIRMWMNPTIEKIKKNNAKKLDEIRKNKEEEILNEPNIKTVLIQEVRRILLQSKGYNEDIHNTKDNALQFIQLNKETKNLDPEEQEKLACGIAVLNEIGRENYKRMCELDSVARKKENSGLKKSVIFGAGMGAAIGAIDYLSQSPYTPAIIGGAIGGLTTGHIIETRLSKKERERKTKGILDEINEVEKKKSEERTDEDINKLKSYLESDEMVLEKYPLARAKAKRILMDELLSTSRTADEKMVSKLNEELGNRLQRSKIKKGFTYAASIIGGAIIGGGGRWLFELAHEQFFVKHTHEPLNLKNHKLKSELAEARARETEELHKPRFLKAEEAEQRVNNEISRIADEQSAKEAALASAQAGGAKTEAAEAAGAVSASGRGAGNVLEQQRNNLLELAVIKKGEGIEHAIRRQLEADPQAHGFKGDINDHAAVHKWSGGEADRIAVKAGYRDLKTGEQIMVGAKGRNNAAYVLGKDAQGNEQVAEYLKGKDGKFAVQETHELAKDFKSAKFEGADKDAYEYIGRHQAEKTGIAEAVSAPREGGQDAINLEHTATGGQAEGVYDFEDKGMEQFFGQKMLYGVRTNNGEKIAFAINDRGEMIEGVNPVKITTENPSEVALKIKDELWTWGGKQTEQIRKLGLSADDLSIRKYEQAGIHPFSRNGLSQADHSKLEFWSRHFEQDFKKSPEEMKRVFEISERSKIDFTANEAEFISTYKKMPVDIKESGIRSSGYMKTFISSEGALEDKKAGLKDLLGLDAAPEIEIKGKVIVVKDVFRLRGFNLLITEDKIGVDGPGRWNWGTGGILKWIKPAADLNAENINTARAEAIELFKGVNKISQ